ncbi:MAG: FAD-binding oxidoreductase [Saprospiraceae bacterium]|nr:FAD-binding oxidoreductase [Saprospiraceae bacterium]
MNQIDCIIVGQGISGSILAYLLRKNGQKVLVFDENREGVLTSSKIAAGVINPITGRRFVKSWRIDALLPAAKSFYQELEKELSVLIWHDRPILRTLRDVEEENNFLLRRTYTDYAPYCGDTTTTPQTSDAVFAPLTHPFFNKFYAFAETKNSAQVNMPLLMSRLRTYFTEKQMLINEEFSFGDLQIEENQVRYKDWTAKKIIFAEGAAGAVNPYFSWLPFNLDKGELLLVRIPDLNLSTIFKNKISIVPLHDIEVDMPNQTSLYWVGATNAWNFADDLPTEANKELIISELREILNCPFEVIAHQAAVRPTVRDRRPLIGWHQKFSVLGIFNGFGTKGASLIPFFAEQFVENLLVNKPLDTDVSINRFRFD